MISEIRKRLYGNLTPNSRFAQRIFKMALTKEHPELAKFDVNKTKFLAVSLHGYHTYRMALFDNLGFSSARREFMGEPDYREVIIPMSLYAYKIKGIGILSFKCGYFYDKDVSEFPLIIVDIYEMKI